MAGYGGGYGMGGYGGYGGCGMGGCGMGGYGMGGYGGYGGQVGYGMGGYNPMYNWPQGYQMLPWMFGRYPWGCGGRY